MLNFFLAILICFFFISPSVAQDQEVEKDKKNGLWVSAGSNYTFSGLALVLNLEWQNRNHIFYTGPKFPLSRTYLPFKGPFGWNIGYKHDYDKEKKKKISFFFMMDYQIVFSKAFSQIKESNKMNYIHEYFLGYGVQFRLSPRLYLANAMGVGGHLESYYNPDLDMRTSYAGYNNLLKFFINYKF